MPREFEKCLRNTYYIKYIIIRILSGCFSPSKIIIIIIINKIIKNHVNR